LACWLHWRFQLRLLQDHTVMAIGAGMAAADMAAGMEAMAAGMVGTAGMAGMAAGMAIPAGMAVAAIGMAAGGDMASARAGVGIPITRAGPGFVTKLFFFNAPICSRVGA
jgi:hypothetical protein